MENVHKIMEMQNREKKKGKAIPGQALRVPGG
jgi:hypothetical protein